MKKFLSALKQARQALKELNLPNKLTLMRIVMVPLYLVLLWFFDNDKSMQIWPLLVFTLASLTDLLDGYIARSRNPDYQLWQIHGSDCRQALTHTAFIMLTAIGRLNVTACIIFIAREFVVSGLRLCAVEQGHVIAAGMSGKIKTVLQMMLVVVLTITGEGLLPCVADDCRGGDDAVLDV